MTAAGFRAIAATEAYWHALADEAAARDGIGIPPRSAVEPRGLELALPYACILERIAPGILRFRLAGVHLNDLLGMEVRSMPLTALFTAPSRDEVQEACEAVCSEPCVMKLAIGSTGEIGRPPLNGYLLLAPLRDETGGCSRILAALQTEGSIGRQPRRFGLRGLARTPISGAVTGQGAVLPAARSPRPAPAQMTTQMPGPITGAKAAQAAEGQGLAETAAVFMHTAARGPLPRVRANLRLVVDNDQAAPAGPGSGGD